MVGNSIQNLPHELLIQIFGHFSHAPRCLCAEIQRYEKNDPTLLSILRVCSVWYKLGVQVLYRNIAVRSPVVLRCNQFEIRNTISMLKALKQQPELYNSIQSLHLWHDYGFKERYVDAIEDMALDLLRSVASRLRIFGLCGARGSPRIAEAISTILPTMTLRILILSSSWYKHMLNTICKQQSCLSIEGLSLVDRSEFDGHINAVSTSTSMPFFMIRTLHLVVWYWPFNVVEALLRSAKSLRTLKLQVQCVWMYHETLDDAYTTYKAKSMINIHKDQLEALELVEFRDDHSGWTIDVSDFPVLNTLHIHANNIFQTPIEQACKRLAAPNLRKLIIDMAFNDQQLGGYHSPKSTHVDWIIDFVRHWKQAIGSSDRLEEIYVICYLDYYWTPSNVLEYDELEGDVTDYPWPLLDLAAAVPILKSMGVHLTWPESYMGRMEWEAKIEHNVQRYKRTRDLPSPNLTDAGYSSLEPHTLEVAQLVAATNDDDFWQERICAYLSVPCSRHLFLGHKFLGQ